MRLTRFPLIVDQHSDYHHVYSYVVTSKNLFLFVPCNNSGHTTHYNTVGWGNKLVMLFAGDSYSHRDLKITEDKTRTLLFLLLFSFKTGQIIVHLFTLYREPASIQQTLYPDGKNHAVPSLHRDSFSAEEPGFYPVLRRVTLTTTTAGPLVVIPSPRIYLIYTYIVKVSNDMLNVHSNVFWT